MTLLETAGFVIFVLALGVPIIMALTEIFSRRK